MIKDKDVLKSIYAHTKEICANIQPPVSQKITCDEETPQAGVDTELDWDRAGNIIVEPMDTVSALVKYSALGKTAILNMASAKRKGGGVENGAMAQEECLFRCSNLYNIDDNFYPIKHDQYIYTHGASFVRDVNYGMMDTVVGDVITMPAINLNTENNYSDYGYSNDQQGYEAMYLDKMYFMINAAALNGCTNIVLGAFGCGVFANNPKDIANLFHETLFGSELYKQFDNVVFAIINDHNSVGDNYNTFKEQFEICNNIQ